MNGDARAGTDSPAAKCTCQAVNAANKFCIGNIAVRRAERRSVRMALSCFSNGFENGHDVQLSTAAEANESVPVSEARISKYRCASSRPCTGQLEASQSTAK